MRLFNKLCTWMVGVKYVIGVMEKPLNNHREKTLKIHSFLVYHV